MKADTINETLGEVTRVLNHAIANLRSALVNGRTIPKDPEDAYERRYHAGDYNALADAEQAMQAAFDSAMQQIRFLCERQRYSLAIFDAGAVTFEPVQDAGKLGGGCDLPSDLKVSVLTIAAQVFERHLAEVFPNVANLPISFEWEAIAIPNRLMDSFCLRLRGACAGVPGQPRTLAVSDDVSLMQTREDILRSVAANAITMAAQYGETSQAALGFEVIDDDLPAAARNAYNVVVEKALADRDRMDRAERAETNGKGLS
jgi:hypothetical protein